MSPLELWGGTECTVNRTREGYRDQTILSGHHHRISDLDLFADLGLSAIRYPVLWERTLSAPGGGPDWTWADARLSRLRELDIRPIVGLVHHGSGPRHTHLLDEGFASGLGHFAGLVAERYDWVEEWTPVNEPLTTARFSALYGHWYPHERSERAFWIALLNQIDATRAAMRAIRRINPAARLIQTEDLGRTYATPELTAQAEHDNLRRWASWDLLGGRVDRHHSLWEIMVRLGLEDRIRRIADDPCPPDVIGLNHYLTSDRFLDHRTEQYPPHLHGGNDQLYFADTEAVRVLDPPQGGFANALREAWDRYATPIAITEVHNGSTREEQLRWAAEAWDMAQAARDKGIDVRAVTAWSLLGSYGWNTLLTGGDRYEPGVFDLSSGVPRPTALAALWQALPRGELRHDVAAAPGWWRRPDRILYGAPAVVQASAPAGGRPLLIVGDPDDCSIVAQACTRRAINYVVNEPSSGSAATDPWGVIELFNRRDDTSNTPHFTIKAEIIPIGRVSSVQCPGIIDAALDLLIDGAPGTWRFGQDTLTLAMSQAHEQCPPQ
ncbi:family 1 glycosylhydrolase [Sphingomonas phyllosphaerae]|uniref:family 1 glycosylhydrolase n=1 Tax=Sphingomonas phyllosphaerae TaxID=257003 RepID=UPI001EE288C4|nr:family 1 glycosylhydrolase [Sphingomonas phyllosphaerae]